MFGTIQNFDIAFVRFVREYIANDFLDTVIPYISRIADKGWFFIILSLVLLCFKKTRRQGLVMSISILLGFIIGNMTLKPLIARPRPCWIDEGIKLLVNNPRDYSFPSGHTLVCFEAAGALLFCNMKKWASIAYIVAVLVAFSRIYLYVHFPTDVIAGVLLGTLFAYVAKKACDTFLFKKGLL